MLSNYFAMIYGTIDILPQALDWGYTGSIVNSAEKMFYNICHGVHHLSRAKEDILGVQRPIS